MSVVEQLWMESNDILSWKNNKNLRSWWVRRQVGWWRVWWRVSVEWSRFRKEGKLRSSQRLASKGKVVGNGRTEFVTWEGGWGIYKSEVQVGMKQRWAV